jgi:hypothetical protein
MTFTKGEVRWLIRTREACVLPVNMLACVAMARGWVKLTGYCAISC